MALELDGETHVSFNSDLSSGLLEDVHCGTPGMHKIRLSVFGYQTDKPLPFGIYAGHVGAYPQLIELAAVLDAPPGKPAVLETEIYLASTDMNEKAPVAARYGYAQFVNPVCNLANREGLPASPFRTD